MFGISVIECIHCINSGFNNESFWTGQAMLNHIKDRPYVNLAHTHPVPCHMKDDIDDYECFLPVVALTICEEQHLLLLNETYDNDGNVTMTTTTSIPGLGIEDTIKNLPTHEGTSK